MFWCYNCESQVQVENLKCSVCKGQAIQAIQQEQQQQNVPSFQPFNVNEASEGSSPSQAQQNRESQIFQSISRMMGGLMAPLMPQMRTIEQNFIAMDRQHGPMLIRYRTQVPTFSILILEGEQIEKKNPVNEQKIKALEKVQQMPDQCAICQQSQGEGLKLPCKHAFHEKCIKPWFEQTNTCPCCRISL